MGYSKESFERMIWRKVIYKRDNWTCQWPDCGLGPRSFPFRHIEAHHIFKWADYPELRFRLSNGITLCKNHHKHVTDREEQFILFFQRIIRKQKKLWSLAKEAAEKRKIAHRYRKSARTASRRRRRKRS